MGESKFFICLPHLQSVGIIKVRPYAFLTSALDSDFIPRKVKDSNMH